MKNKLFLVPLLLLCSFSATSCDKEDGNISEWVGTYGWVTNELQHWSYMLGTKTLVKTDSYNMEKTIDMEIRENKIWIFPEPKDPNLGKRGGIKCYKDHINLQEMNLDYKVEEKYNFKLKVENSGTYLEYYYNSDPGVGDHYDYEIRKVQFKLIK